MFLQLLNSTLEARVNAGNVILKSLVYAVDKSRFVSSELQSGIHRIDKNNIHNEHLSEIVIHILLKI